MKIETGVQDVLNEIEFELAQGTVSRDDVADTLVAVLDTPSTVGKTFELLAGDTPIMAAVSRL